MGILEEAGKADLPRQTRLSRDISTLKGISRWRLADFALAALLSAIFLAIAFLFFPEMRDARGGDYRIIIPLGVAFLMTYAYKKFFRHDQMTI